MPLGWASAQEGLRERVESMQSEAVRLAELGRHDAVAAARKTATELTHKAQQQERISRTESEIAELSHLLSRLSSKLGSVASEEEKKHLDRESRRILLEIERRTAELNTLRRDDDRRAETRAEHALQREGRAHARDLGLDRAHQEDRVRRRDTERLERGSDDLTVRLEHAHRAIEHLHESGMHDVAEQAEQRAQEMQRELAQRERHPREEIMHEMMNRIEMLSRQVQELEREVQRLRK